MVVKVLEDELGLHPRVYVLPQEANLPIGGGTQTATCSHPKTHPLNMQLSRSRALSVCTGLLLANSCSAAALPTNMTAIKVFDDDSCSGAPLQVVFTPTDDCSSPTVETDCSLEAQELGIFASGGCTNDPHEFSSTLFGASPYVLVELHGPDSNCASLEGVAAYRIDSDCHPTIDAGTSFQVDWDDVTSKFKLFADASCGSTPTFEFDMAVSSNECHGGSMKLHVYEQTEKNSR